MSGPANKDVTDPSIPATPAIPAAPAIPATAAAPATPAAPAAPAAAGRSFFDRYKKVLIVGLVVLAAIAIGFGLGPVNTT